MFYRFFGSALVLVLSVIAATGANALVPRGTLPGSSDVSSGFVGSGADAERRVEHFAPNGAMQAVHPNVPLLSPMDMRAASVQLQLSKSIIPATHTGETAELRIIARNAKGAIIVGSGLFLDRFGKPLTIAIHNSSPANTVLSPSVFEKPSGNGPYSAVATVTFTGRAHFDYPTFTVENPGLAPPGAGVTLAYLPDSGVDIESSPPPNLIGFEKCAGGGASVGGFFYGGPYFGRFGDACRVAINGHPGDTYSLDSTQPTPVVLGFGSDKKIYYAYADPTNNGRTIFGYLRNLTNRVSADISSVSGLTLGRDGSLWFSGSRNGKATIGKLPPAGSGWHPTLFSLPDPGASISSIEPGIGDTMVFLYSTPSATNAATINTNFSGFHHVTVLPDALAGHEPGDLIAGPGGSFFIRASVTMSREGTIYRISSNGALTAFCPHVQTMYRLADGTGAGYRNPQNEVENHAIVHLVPINNSCTLIPLFNPDNSPSGGSFEHGHTDAFGDGLGVDSTTDDWIFYTDPNGHRLGVF